MAKYTPELATPPPVTVSGVVIQQPAASPGGQGGSGYPTGTPGSPTYYPNSPATPPVATNPHGAANSPDEYPAVGVGPAAQLHYSPQTFEEKIAAMVPVGVPSVPVTVAANQPYPTTP